MVEQYGKDYVPISDEVEADMKYQAGEKGMELIGFVDADRIPRHLLLKV